jgi:shikimate kinase
MKPPRTIVLVGMMGAGKTAVGRRLATRLDLPFIDADEEIEAAAGCSIEDIFTLRGEEEFRSGERRVIKRILTGPVCILATGGGAFMDTEIRDAIASNAVSIWLSANLETLWHRVQRRSNRPLLKTEKPKETLRTLIEQRYPIYAKADIEVESNEGPADETVDRVIAALERYVHAEKRT